MTIRHRSLAMRAFLYASVPMCFVLATGFLAIHAALKEKVKEGLKVSLSTTENALARTTAGYQRRNRQLLTILSENAGIKAGIGLLREARHRPEERAQIRQTIETQLLELASTVEYDLLLAADVHGQPVAGVVRANGEIRPVEDADLLPLSPDSLLEMGGSFYETMTLPVNLGAENLGSLMVGRKFDLAPWNEFGYAALLTGSRIVLANIPAKQIGAVGSQLQSYCGGDSGCEIEVGGEAYLALPVKHAEWGTEHRLFALQSIAAPMRDFMRGFSDVFLLIGAGGVLAVFLLSAVGSRYVSNPITKLIALLKESERTGTLRSDFPTQSVVEEVNLLAQALNRAAAAVSESQWRLDQATLQFVETMAQALDARDAYTAGHSDRVSANSTAIAQALGLPPKEVETIRIGAKLHDIGKIGVPDAILQKPGRLTPEEFAVVQQHPQIGKRILEKVGRFQDILPIVELHHEDFDGGGYPYGLKGEGIPLGVRIVHVADVYDAITSSRTYRSAMPERQVLEIMESGAGKEFDPVVVRAFLSLLARRRTLDSLLEGASRAPEASLTVKEFSRA